MSVLIIHLTDAHLRESDENVLVRAEQVVAASLSPVMNVDAFHVILSGDFTQSGKKAQFELAKRFLEKIKALLKQNDVKVDCIVSVAGNHDCDFEGDQSVRNLLLEAVKKNPKGMTPSVASQIGSVLTSYKEFRSSISSSLVEINPWISSCVVDGGLVIQYFLIDSALMSQLVEEQGHLFVGLPEREDISVKADRVIYVMHHPLNWLSPDNARELAQFASATGDIFLMGHEHINWSQRVTELFDNSTIHYLKGHVFRDSSDPSNSAFQTIEVCKQAGFKTRKYVHNGSRFVQDETGGAVDFVAWPASSRTSGLAFSDGGFKKLSDAGAAFTHRRKGLITLPDIFVWPELKSAVTSKEAGGVVLDGGQLSAERLLKEYSELSPVILIRGGEQSGKSALSKMLSVGMNRQGLYPLLLSASDVSSWRERSLDDRIDSAITDLYGKDSRDEYRQLPKDKKCLLIDDFDLLQVTKGYYDGLKALRSSFGKIFLMIDSHPGMELALNEFLKDESFVDSEIYELAPMSYSNRLVLIEKWLSIGAEENDEDFDVKVLAAKFSKIVDETLGRNFIPSVPLFVLIILQRSELEQDLNTMVKSGSHGFLYESLITQALSTGVRSCTLDTALTYLSHLAMRMYKSGIDSLTENEYAHFHLDHCEKYDLGLNLKKLREELASAEVLSFQEDFVRLTYPYQYYYFLARHLATIVSWVDLEPYIVDLVSEIHTEKAANVLLFLAHLTRNPNIAALILERANSMFEKYEEADLFSNHKISSEFTVPVIRQFLVDGTRAQKIENYNADIVIADEAAEGLTNAARNRLQAKLNDALAMNASFKAIQVLGQLLRNHAGSMEKDEKRQVASACVSLGLRTLGFLLDTVESHGKEILEFRGLQLKAENPKRDREDIAEELNFYLPSMVSGITVGTLIKVANAVGSEELAPTLASVLSDGDTKKLIGIIAELEHFSDFPEKNILDFNREKIKPADVLPYSILRRFIVRRFHLFPVMEELKNSICQVFKIKSKPFAFLEQKKALQHQSKGTRQ